MRNLCWLCCIIQAISGRGWGALLSRAAPVGMVSALPTADSRLFHIKGGNAQVQAWETWAVICHLHSCVGCTADASTTPGCPGRKC